MGQINENAAESWTSVNKIDKYMNFPTTNQNRNIQVVKMDSSILDYFKMVMDFDNESKEYQEITINEFKYELEKSLNCGTATKQIEWLTK
jgi:hypothetical protein